MSSTILLKQFLIPDIAVQYLVMIIGIYCINFFRNLSCNPKNYEVGDPLTKWAVAKWAIYEVGGLSYEVGSCEVGELRSGKKLRSGRFLRSGATPSWELTFSYSNVTPSLCKSMTLTVVFNCFG